LVLAAWRLIELGPKALPALLAAVDDATPIADSSNSVFSGIVSEDDSRPMSWRGVSGREIAIIQELVPKPEKLSPWGDASKQICRGDLCYAILGEIVGRNYRVWDRLHQVHEVGSPVHNPQVAAAVRRIWSSDYPATTLFDSLVGDGVRDAVEKPDVWNSPRCAGAQALARLAFNFPEETTSFFVKAIKASDPRLEGVWAALVSRANPTVMPALVRRLHETDDPNTLASLLGPSLVTAAPDIMAQRIAAAARTAPPEYGAPGHERLLRRALVVMPASAPPAFLAVLDQRSAVARMAALSALYHAKVPPEWTATMLVALLDDPSDVPAMYGASGAARQMRVKDLAAIVITKAVRGTSFDPGAEPTDRDEQINALRAVLDRIASGATIEVAEPESIAPLAEVTFAQPGAYVWLDPLSTHEHVYGITLACGGSTRLLDIDVASGATKDTPIVVPGNEDVTLMSQGTGPGGATLLTSKTHVFALDHATSTVRVLATLPDAGDRPMLQKAAVVGDKLCYGASDGTVYTVSLVDGATNALWKRPPSKDQNDPHFNNATIVAVNPGRMLVTFFFAHDEPPRLIDVASGGIETLQDLPTLGWSGGWGKFAWDNLNGIVSLWNLQTRKKVSLPIPSQEMTNFVDTGNERFLFVELKDGSVAMVDLQSKSQVASLNGGTPGRGGVRLSHDRTTLFRIVSESGDEKQGPPIAVHVAMWDVSKWTNP